MNHEQRAALVAVGIRPGPHSLQDEQVVFLHLVDDAAFAVGDAFRDERGPDRFGLRRGEPELFEHPALESPPPAASVPPTMRHRLIIPDETRTRLLEYLASLQPGPASAGKRLSRLCRGRR